MSSANLKTGALLAVFLLQLMVPGMMIARREAALRDGSAYKFKTRPIDPFDPFRGRYVALWFSETAGEAGYEGVRRGHKVYVEVFQGEDGFAKLGKATRERPDGVDYIKARIAYVSGGSQVQLELPFDRYYMNEKKAPAAERVYWERARDTNSTAYAVVKVLDGMAVTEGLFVDGVHILDYLEANPQRDN